jgi:hypothetical protein
MTPTPAAKRDWSRWAGPAVTIAVVLLAYAAQWGALSSQIAAMCTDLKAFATTTNEAIKELRRTDERHNTRISTIEGQHKIVPPSEM